MCNMGSSCYWQSLLWEQIAQVQLGKYLTVACTAMWNKMWNMGFESKLAPLTVWLHTIQRQMSDGHWYNKIPEVLGNYRQVVQCDASSFTSISCITFQDRYVCMYEDCGTAWVGGSEVWTLGFETGASLISYEVQIWYSCMFPWLHSGV